MKKANSIERRDEKRTTSFGLVELKKTANLIVLWILSTLFKIIY